MIISVYIIQEIFLLYVSSKDWVVILSKNGSSSVLNPV